MLKLNFIPKFSILIIFSFILFTVIGTLTHEFGHIAVAKYFGYETRLNYGSSSIVQKGYVEDEDVKEIEKIYKKYLDFKYEELPNELKLKVEELQNSINKKFPQNRYHNLWITAGGPAQTLLTSFIGLTILYIRRNQWRNGFKILDWFAVFMTLFALREVFNFITSIYASIISSKSNFHGDEFRISRYLGFNEWIVPSIALILGLIITFIAIFKIIPVKYRFTFIISGLVGSISGYAIWFGFLGEALFNS